MSLQSCLLPVAITSKLLAWPPAEGWGAEVGPGRVSWNVSFVLLERQKLFLYSLLRSGDKKHIKKKSGTMCEKSLQSLEGTLHLLGAEAG